MKWCKRACIYLQRNIKRIMNLFLILFILGNVMCIVSSLRTSSFYLSDVIKAKIGATVIYKDSRYNNYEYTIKNDEDLRNLYQYEEILKQMINHDLVNYGNYSYMMFLQSQDQVHYGYGVSSSPMVDVLENKIEIIEGREITQEEIKKGERVVLVGEGSTFYGKKIQLNDELPMMVKNTTIECSLELGCIFHEDFGENYTLKVVGIFKKIDKAFDYQNQGFDNISNRWYVPNHVLVDIFEERYTLSDYEKLVNPLNIGIDEPLIRLKKSDHLKTYERDIKPLLLNEKDKENHPYDILYTSDDEFKILSQPIQILSQLGNVLFIGSILVFSLLLSIMSISVIKERIYEIGIYLAMGERKYKVITQLFLEFMIISTISISCSFISGIIIGEQVTNQFISQEIVEEYEIETVEIDKITYFIHVYGTSCGIILLALVYPFIFINKENPKEILLK